MSGSIPSGGSLYRLRFWLRLLFRLGLLLRLLRWLEFGALSVPLNVVNQFASGLIALLLTDILIGVAVARKFPGGLFSTQRFIRGPWLAGLHVIDDDNVRLWPVIDKRLGSFVQGLGTGFDRRRLFPLGLAGQLHRRNRLKRDRGLDVIGIGHF
jgi:hypothetical protein